MHRSPSHPSPTRSDRTTIALITLFFVFVSAIFHFVAGNFGAGGFGWRSAEPTTKPYVIDVSRLLETPAPTPTPTRPPPRTPVQSKPLPMMHATAAPVHRANIALPRRRSAASTAASANPSGTLMPVATLTAQPQLPVETTGGPDVSATPLEERDMIIAAEFEHRVTPQYPAIAVTARWEGTVIVLVTIGPDGIIEAHIGTSSGYAVLDRAGLEAAKESTYRPPELNGKPAIETYRVIYTFSLDGA